MQILVNLTIHFTDAPQIQEELLSGFAAIQEELLCPHGQGFSLFSEQHNTMQGNALIQHNTPFG